MSKQIDNMVWALMASAAMPGVAKMRRDLEESTARSRQRAIAAGHPEWGNACTSCGCEMQISEQAQCYPCQIRRAFPDNRLTSAFPLEYRGQIANPHKPA
uniref:Uncharacterized protein n=1 Tax=Geobacter sp. (strain M21) TaxID=443144 RepID=C6E6S3_GEOSM